MPQQLQRARFRPQSCQLSGSLCRPRRFNYLGTPSERADSRSCRWRAAAGTNRARNLHRLRSRHLLAELQMRFASSLVARWRALRVNYESQLGGKRPSRRQSTESSSENWPRRFQLAFCLLRARTTNINQVQANQSGRVTSCRAGCGTNCERARADRSAPVQRIGVKMIEAASPSAGTSTARV